MLGISGIPDIKEDDSLPEILLGAMQRSGIQLEDGDVLVMAHKIVSKAEGRVSFLRDVEPSYRARQLGKELNKDPRKVEVILRESNRVVRAHRHEGKSDGVLICEHRLGFISANAGVDESNLSAPDSVLLLPEDPDRSAQQIRDAIRKRTGRDIGVVITDSFGRPWRMGIINVAIGLAGVPALHDMRGQVDSSGRRLSATTLAVADELAAASGLIMRKTARTPCVLIKGLPWSLTESSARELIRARKEDLFS